MPRSPIDFHDPATAALFAVSNTGLFSSGETVQAIADDMLVLKPGSNQWKLGGEILKGDWRGFPVYALTLEERATCPKTCQHWRSCYGNRMHRAHRMPHGTELERRLEIEIAQHAEEHPNGFAVRLHVLGDFYSVEYVELWRKLLERHPVLEIRKRNVKKEGKFC
jgi:hypothetical protein